MKWSPDADAAIHKVPFFVRKRVRKKVETKVREAGKHRVTLSDVQALKRQFLAKGGMEKHIRGYDVSACFGGDGCPNSACSCSGLLTEITDLVERADLLSFLKKHVTGDLKFHHEFKVSLSDCPNACSRPQIADIGIIGAVVPGVGTAECSFCDACVDICPDRAIHLSDQGPVIDPDGCQNCGKCVPACPTGTIEPVESGFRVMLGGRLGRYPRLAMELPGIYSRQAVLDIVQRCIDFYKIHSKKGERFAHLLKRVDQVTDPVSKSGYGAAEPDA